MDYIDIIYDIDKDESYLIKDRYALPAADLPEAINTALAQAKESGEFDGAQGPAGPAGESGVYVGTEAPTDPNVKVWINPNGVATFPMPTADDAGKVLKAKGANEAEWGEASGGGTETWELVADVTLEENVASLVIDTDVDGNAFKLSKVLVYVHCVPNDDMGGNRKFLGFSDDVTYQKGARVELCTHPTTETGYDLRDMVYAESINGKMFIRERRYSGNTTSLWNSIYAEIPSPGSWNTNGTDGVDFPVLDADSPCEAIKVLGYQNPIIGVGDRIIVWGVRA